MNHDASGYLLICLSLFLQECSCWQGTLHGEREQSKSCYFTKWHQLVHSSPLPVKSQQSHFLSFVLSEGRVKSLGAFGSEDSKHIMDPTMYTHHSYDIIPFPLVSCRWRIFLWFLKPHGPMYVLFSSLTPRFRYLRLDNEVDIFFKNCCGFAATLRVVICIVWFRTYLCFWWQGKGLYWSIDTSESSLVSYPWCTFKWRVIRIFYRLIYFFSLLFLQRPPLSF